jgi:exodeoxyribonuclease VIII
MNDETPNLSEVLLSEVTPGIYPDISNDAYHAGDGISKSGLWTLYTQSPAHYRFAERETSQAFDFGTACHTAILEPETFEARTMRGPMDRRGNNWKDAQAEATNTGRLLLTAPDFDAVLTIRDAVHADAWLNALIVSPHSQVEHSSYWIDEETGVLCRSRPDLYRADLGIMVDVKSTVSAHPDAFARSVVNYGYHAQEAWYTDGHRANGQAVEGFVFLAWEKKSPFVTARYELPPSIVAEGRAICRKALATYAECQQADQWPGYSSEITELTFKPWSYAETDAPRGEEAA